MDVTNERIRSACMRLDKQPEIDIYKYVHKDDVGASTRQLISSIDATVKSKRKLRGE